MHMFQSNKTKKKKEKLWSACQTLRKNVNQDSSIMPSVQQQQPHHQRLHHLQEEAMYDVEEQQDDIALPPYSQMNCNISNIAPICYASYHNNPTDMETSSERMSVEQDYETKIGGYCCESYCESTSDDCSHHYCNRMMAVGSVNDMQLLTSERLGSNQMLLSSTNYNSNNNNNSTTVTTMGNALTRYWYAGNDSVSSESSIAKRPHPQKYSPMMKTVQPSAPTSVKTATTTTTPSVFRNCCFGRGSESSESSIGTCIHPLRNQTCTLNNNNNNAIGINNNNYNTSKNNFNFFEQKPTTTSLITTPTTTNDIIGSVRDYFKALMKRLKEPQVDTLYQVVATRAGINDTNHAAQQNATHQFSDCILVQRETIKGKDPNVIACLLWLWPDLKTSAELKRVPMCPNGKEKVYVCCNPAHWNRIVIPEAVPPPYQESVMDRLRPEDRAPSENLKDAGFSSTSGLRVQIPESFTTNGEAHSSPSRKWCEILYFELAERVGNKYVAENSIVNVYSEGSGGMCLKNCFGATNRKSVEKVRQKIGLGITLSQEADGVWLYNRSEAPIFIHSPTLNEDYRHVTKVPPGYCLNAFDSKRARTQKRVYPSQIAGAQTGPVDVLSMKISFAKGWGSKYRRQDITACQCWLDVIFFLPR